MRVKLNLTNDEYTDQNEPEKSESFLKIENQDNIPSKMNDINNIETHGGNGYGLFCVTEKDLEMIDIESLFDDEKY